MDKQRNCNRLRSASGFGTNIVEALENRRLMSVPQITSFTATPPVVASLPAAITLSVDATDPSGIRGITFFRDHDRNGVWTPGVDQDLGFVTQRAGNSRFELSPSAGQQANWPEFVEIRANAVDNTNIWGIPQAVTIRTNVAGSVPTVTLTDPIAAPGQSFTIRINTRGSVKAVSAFVDTDNNGQWDSSRDIPLGDSKAPVTGSARTFEIRAVADMNWPIVFDIDSYRVPIVATVQNGDGTWTASPRKASQGLELDSLPEVDKFEAYWAPGQSIVQFDGYASDSAFKTNAADGSPEIVTFFLDVNQNNRWDGSSVDIDVGLVRSTTAFFITLPADPSWPANARFVATARDNRIIGDGWGQPRTAIPIASNALAPESGYLDVSTGSFNGGIGIGAGDTFQLFSFVGNATRSLPVQATFFLDRNSNGVLDVGTDLTIFTQTKNADGDGFVSFNTPVIPYEVQTYGVGFQRFGVFYASQGLTPSAPYGARQRFMEKPAIGNFSSSTIQLSAGQELSFDFTAYGSAMVRGIEGKIDLDRDGAWDTFSDRSQTSVSRMPGGTPNATRWNIRFSTSGLAIGSYNVFLDGVNVEGVWAARRYNITLQIV